MHILINKKYLTLNDYKAKCAIGKRGIGYKRKEGDLITPKGIYKIKYILYRKDESKKYKPKLKKLLLEKIWDGVMIQNLTITINLLSYPLLIVLKNF